MQSILYASVLRTLGISRGIRGKRVYLETCFIRGGIFISRFVSTILTLCNLVMTFWRLTTLYRMSLVGACFNAFMVLSTVSRTYGVSL